MYNILVYCSHIGGSHKLINALSFYAVYNLQVLYFHDATQIICNLFDEFLHPKSCIDNSLINGDNICYSHAMK